MYIIALSNRQNNTNDNEFNQNLQRVAVTFSPKDAWKL